MNVYLKDSRYITKTKIRGKLYSLGGIPGVKDEEGSVVVEVYEVDDRTLRSIDRIEGHPTGYRRTPTVTECGLEVEYYLWQHDVFEEIPSGDYEDYRRS